jgi:hypothetical protein
MSEWITPAAAAVWIATRDIDRIRRFTVPQLNGDVHNPHGDRDSSAMMMMALQEATVSAKARAADHYVCSTRMMDHAWAEIKRVEHSVSRFSIDHIFRPVQDGFIHAQWAAKGSRVLGGPAEDIQVAGRDAHYLEGLNARSPTEPTWYRVVLRFEDVLKDFPDPKAEVSPDEATSSGDGRPNVSRADLASFLSRVADGHKKESELRASAEEHFAGKCIRDALWRSEFKGLPAQKKRSRGQTDRTLKNDNTAA